MIMNLLSQQTKIFGAFFCDFFQIHDQVKNTSYYAHVVLKEELWEDDCIKNEDACDPHRV